MSARFALRFPLIGFWYTYNVLDVGEVLGYRESLILKFQSFVLGRRCRSAAALKIAGGYFCFDNDYTFKLGDHLFVALDRSESRA